MRKKTLRTKVMCALLSLVFLASILNVQLPVEAKGGTATIPITVGGQTYHVTPGQNVTVNTPGGSTTYNVRFVDGKPVALDMTQHTSLIFGEGAGSGATTGATTGKPTTGTNGASTSGNVGTGNSSSASQATGATNSGNAAQSSSSASTNNSGNMSWNDFQKANAGKGMSNSEMSQAWKDYKAGNTGSTSSSSAAQSGSSSSSSAAQTSGSNSGSSSPAPQASVAEGAATTNSGSAQGSSVSSEAASQGNSNWNPAKHPRDPQTGKFISHEEAIARGLMDPADANVSTNGSSSQTAQSGEASQSQTTGGSSSETAQASTEGSQSGSSNGGESGTAAQAAQTSGEAAQASGKTKTTIGDKFKAGYAKGKELTNAGVQNVKDSLKSGFSAKNLLVTAGITVGVDLATQIMRGENPSLKSALKTVCCAEFVGGVTGSVLGAATGSFFVPFLSCIPVVGGALSALAPTFGSVVGSSVGAYLAGDIKNGRFSIKEAFKRIDWVGVTGQTIGSTVGAALGSCLGPVGTVLGGMAGGYFGNWAAHKIAGMFGKGEANLPTITMPTGENGGGSVTTAGTITLGGDEVTGVIITNPVVPSNDDDDDDNDNRRPVDAGDIDAQITAAYEEYTMYYEEYSNLIQAGKQAEAIEVAQKMNQAKAKYDSLRYQD